MSEEFAPTPPAQTIPLETLVAEIESDPEMKIALDEARKMDMLEGATVTDITPAQDDEPVAYMDVHDNWDLYKNKPEQIDVIPLYTRPDNSELRQAAEEACGMLEGFLHSEWLGTDQERQAVRNLRAALEEK